MTTPISGRNRVTMDQLRRATMSSYKIDRTVHVVVPVRVQCDTEESFAEHAKSLRPSIDYGGAGVRGGYSVKSGEPVVEPVYRVKGLVWERVEDGLTCERATYPGIEYKVWDGPVGSYWRLLDVDGPISHECWSIEAGKLAAESHWKARIAACLEEVK